MIKKEIVYFIYVEGCCQNFLVYGVKYFEFCIVDVVNIVMVIFEDVYYVVVLESDFIYG